MSPKYCPFQPFGVFLSLVLDDFLTHSYVFLKTMQNNQEEPSLDLRSSLTVQHLGLPRLSARSLQPRKPAQLCPVTLPELQPGSAVKQKAEAIVGFTLLVFNLSEIAVLCALMSSVLKSIVSRIFPLFWFALVEI